MPDHPKGKIERPRLPCRTAADHRESGELLSRSSGSTLEFQLSHLSSSEGKVCHSNNGNIEEETDQDDVGIRLIG